MKRGPLFETQAEDGARFTQRSGWDLPAAFSSPRDELAALSDSVGLADWTGWGVLRLGGRSRLDFVQRLSTNDVLRMTPGQGVPTVFTTPVGRIVDLAFALVRENDLLLIVGRGADEKVADWLQRHVFFNDDLVVENWTDQWGLMGVGGPRSASMMADLLGPRAADLMSFQSLPTQIEGVATTLVRSVPLGNEYLLMTRASEAAALWSRLAATVEATGGALVGELALETARVRAGWPRFGRELSEDYIPLEAGLKWAVSFDKGCYVGQEIVARMETYQRLSKRLVVLRCDIRASSEASPLETGDQLWVDGKTVGRMTSIAPLRDQGVVKALAYIKSEVARPGQALNVGDPNDGLTATVLALSGESG